MDEKMKKYLSEEIVAHIISRVPTKSILRFKVACKSWCRLFDDPFFIRMHLRQIIPKGNSSLLLRHAVPEEKESSERNKKKKSVTYTWKRHFKGNFSLRSMTTFRERSKPQLPIHWRERFTSIVGSAHGIVCIADRENNDLALWNPTTGELKHLPEFRKMTSDYTVVALGFTFNPKLKDYQVATVFISYCKPDFKAQVFSVSTNRWRHVDDTETFECGFEDFVSKANLGGILHWLVFDMQREDLTHGFILYFDTTKDEFGAFTYPQICKDTKGFVLQSGRLRSMKKESLFLFVYDICIPGCDIWIMEEYGNVTSWTRLYSFPLEVGMQPIGKYLGRDCDILVERVENDDPEESNLYAYCARSVSFRNLRARTPKCIFRHMETLIPISQLPAMLMGSSSSASSSNA